VVWHAVLQNRDWFKVSPRSMTLVLLPGRLMGALAPCGSWHAEQVPEGAMAVAWV